MSLPKSAKFDIVDWNSRASLTDDSGDSVLSPKTNPPNIPLNSQTADVSHSPFGGILIQDSRVDVLADGTEANTKTLEHAGFVVSDFDAGLPDTFTFEFDVQLSENIPKDTSNVNNRAFVGALDLQGYAAGFLFSYQGISIASYPEDPSPTPLGGSADFLMGPEGIPITEPVTVRAIVDGETKRLSIYINKASEAYLEDADIGDLTLRYNIAARESEDIYPDAVVVAASAESALLAEDGVAQSVLFSLSSIRLSSSAVLPVEKPVASASVDPINTVGQVVKLSSYGSYDPLGRELTFSWELVAKPDGSKILLPKSRHARASFGSVETDNAITFKFYERSFEGNLWSVVISDPGVFNAPLVIKSDKVSKIIEISLKTDGAGNILTTAKKIIETFTGNGQAEGYDIVTSGGVTEEGTVFDPIVLVEIGANESSLGLVPTGTFKFSGGYTSKAETPTFVPDKVGAYVFSLRVSVVSELGKTRTSDTVYASTTVTISEQLYNHRPNSQYIWKHLSDYWNLVDSKEHATLFWSALTQIIASDTLIAWQNDYNKTISDIGRTYQRRWLNHKTKLDFPDYVEAKIYFPGAYKTVSVQTIDTNVDDSVGQVFVSGTPSAPLTLSWGATTGYTPFLVKSSLAPPSIAEVISVDSIGPDFWRILATDKSFSAHVSVVSRESGRFVVDDDIDIPGFPEISTVFHDPTYEFFGVDKEVYKVRIKNIGASPVIYTISGVTDSGNAVLVVDPQQVGGKLYSWDLVKVPTKTVVEQTPYIRVESSITHPDYESDFLLSSLNLSTGDLLSLGVVTPGATAETIISVPILVATDKDMFVGWNDLVLSLSLQDSETYTIESLADFVVRPICIYRARKLEEVEGLRSIPYLGYTTVNPSDLKENVDYVIEDGVIRFFDRIYGTCVATEGSNIVTLTKHVSAYPGGTTELDGAELLSTTSGTLYLKEGDVDSYSILAVDGDDIHLSREVSIGGTVAFCLPRFGVGALPPDEYWSEVAHLDNHSAIEDNFGLYVGLSKEYVDAYDENLDYLSVVKSACFAFMNGPQIANIKSSVQTMLGLPYAEVAGQVIALKEATPTQTGSIVVLGVDGKYYHYEFPFGATISLNPSTGETIGLYDKFLTAKEVSELSGDELKDYNNAIIPAFSKIVDVITIADYISDPLVVEQHLDGGEILKKYHTFIVDVPLDVTNTTQVFPMIRGFLEDIKPAHTNFILVGSINLSDTISVVDEEFLFPTLILNDTPHTSPFFGKKDEVGVFNEAVMSEAKEVFLWPKEATVLKGKEQSSVGIIHNREPADPFPGPPGWPFGDTFVELFSSGVVVVFEKLVGGKVFIRDDFNYFGDGFYAQVLGSFGQLVQQAGMNLVYYTLKLGHLDTGEDLHYGDLNRHAQGANANIGVGIYFIGYLDQLNASPLSSWGIPDVKEKYESGYCAGVLDDYSGDGSWNASKSTLGMVNTLNSDIDVVNSKMRVPVVKVTTGEQENIEFILGEEVDVLLGGVIHPGSIWITSPPVVEYVGSGFHPKLPFNICSPQNEHPNTYIQLSFENDKDLNNHPAIPTVAEGWDSRENLGGEERLQAVFAASLAASLSGEAIYLKGRESGALAQIHYPFPDVRQAAHDSHFDIERIWQTDKLLEYGPVSDPTFMLTTYIPLFAGQPSVATGTTVEEFKSRSPSFDPDGAYTAAAFPAFGYVDYALTADRLEQETQLEIFNPDAPANEQFVPSFGPGFYTSWAEADSTILEAFGLNPGDPVPDSDLLPVTWGFDDVGTLLNTPTGINQFHRQDWTGGITAESTLGIQNVHIGLKIRSNKTTHLTHGYTEFFIPKPSINQVTWNAIIGTARIEGSYFVEVDNTQATIPTISTFDGVKGGCWVFFKHADSGQEYSAVGVSFETGKAGALGLRSVLGIDGFYQTSTGHVLTAAAPLWLMLPGEYKAVIRNYRPYKMCHTAPWELHIDEEISQISIGAIPIPEPEEDDGEFGDDDFGDGPFGG